MPCLLDAANGNTEKQDRSRKLDGSISPRNGKNRGHIGGPTDEYYRGQDEEHINSGTSASEICKPTDLTGLMTPGHCPTGVTSTDLDIGQARRKASMCARGAGNLIL